MSANPKLINWIAHFGLGKAYLDQGFYGISRQEFEKSLVLNPKNPAVYKNLGIIYAQYLPNKRRALIMLETYLKLNPSDKQKKEIERAVSELKKT